MNFADAITQWPFFLRTVCTDPTPRLYLSINMNSSQRNSRLVALLRLTVQNTREWCSVT